MEAAYKGLDDEIRQKIEGLRAVHDFTQSFGLAMDPKTRAEKQKEFPPVEHPVVRVHARTGRRSLFVNPGYTMCINGVPRDEGDAMLEELFAHIENEQFCYRHRWTAGQMVGIDNRATLHCAMADYREPMRKLRMIVGCTERGVPGDGNLLD